MDDESGAMPNEDSGEGAAPNDDTELSGAAE
jgi:hypothetical protein